MSFSSKTTKTNQSFNQQTDPWDEAIPMLKGFLANLSGVMGTPGATADQKAAYDRLKTNAGAGNPNTADILALSKDQFATPDRSGTVTEGYADLERRLTDTANGKNLDLANNEYLQKMLTQVGDEAQNRVNASFAAAGRDFSGANQGAVARGVTAAQAPLLLDMFTREQGRTDAAARDLFGAAGSTASQTAQLDQIRNALRMQGIDTTGAFMTARDSGDNTILNLEQQLKSIPAQDLAAIANLLFPAAGLGSQSTGNSQGTSKTSGFGVTMSDVGKFATGLGSFF